MEWHQIGTGLALDWHALANFVPILDNWRTIVHLTKEQVFYTGWSLVYSEDEFKEYIGQ